MFYYAGRMFEELLFDDTALSVLISTTGLTQAQISAQIIAQIQGTKGQLSPGTFRCTDGKRRARGSDLITLRNGAVEAQFAIALVLGNPTARELWIEAAEER